MTPEAKARETIDALLLSAGWHVCGVADANIHAALGVAIREFPLNTGFGFTVPLPPQVEQARIVAEVDRHLSIIREVETEVDANLKRAQALRQATLAKAFAVN